MFLAVSFRALRLIYSEKMRLNFREYQSWLGRVAQWTNVLLVRMATPRTYTVAFGAKIAEIFDQLSSGQRPLRNPQAWIC